MTPKELFAIIDKRWKWVAKDADGEVWVHSEKPHSDGDQWTNEDNQRDITPLFSGPINFGTDDWTKCIARRDEIDMDGVVRVFLSKRDSSLTDGLTAVVEYVRKQLERTE